MKTVWKYELTDNINELYLHPKAVLRFVGVVDNRAYVWVETPLEPNIREHSRIVEVWNTGTAVKSNRRYIGTVMFPDGLIVQHVYEVERLDSFMENIVSRIEPDNTGHIYHSYNFYGHNQKYLKCLYRFHRMKETMFGLEYEYVLVDAEIVKTYKMES
jgi:hypothetical protein